MRNAATGTDFVMPIEFDRWLESARMEKILEAGEENRQADIELGRQLERERILHLLENQKVAPLAAWDIYMEVVREIIEEES